MHVIGHYADRRSWALRFHALLWASAVLLVLSTPSSAAVASFLHFQHAPHTAGSVSIALFGVFDGHGGKQAATYASNHIMPNLLDALQGAKLPAEKVR